MLDTNHIDVVLAILLMIVCMGISFIFGWKIHEIMYGTPNRRK